jgi:hypothetical protein
MAASHVRQGHGRCRFSRRQWSIALVALPLLSMFGAGNGEAAAVARQPIMQSYLGDVVQGEAFPRSVQVCVHEVLNVEIELTRYRRYHTQNNAEIEELVPSDSSGDTAKAHLSGAGDLSLTDVFGSTQLYEFHADEPGHATITFDITTSPSADVSAPPPIDIQVSDCDFEIHTFGIWHISAGFNIVFGASIDTVITRDQGGSLLTSDPKMKNLAAAFPVGGCAATFTESTSPAHLVGITPGNAGPDYGNLLLDIKFDTIQAATEVCHVPHANGGTQNSGELDDIHFEFPLAGGEGSNPHVLHAQHDVTGVTFATAIPIYLAP